MEDPFCMKHNVPYDAFEGCWRCTGEARDREDEKRRATNEKDAEIERLRARVAELEAALPTEEEEASVRLALTCVNPASRYAGCLIAGDRVANIREWLARLDAARAKGGR